MKGKKFLVGLLAAAMVCSMAGMVLADSIDPASFSASILVGGSTSIDKFVTVSAGTPTEGQGDVFFLCDTTGSMGGTISSVKTNALAILTGLSGYGNIETGAGYYRDFYTGYESKGWGSPGDLPYFRNAAIGGAASTQAGINAWSAGGGNDGLEADLYALAAATTDAGTGWRTGSEKFILWFGDVGGHEPSNTTGYPGPSTADTIAALTGAGVTVYAFDVGSLDNLGQATAITEATGGELYDDGLGADVVDTIIGAIGEGFASYSVVGLDLSEVPDGLEVEYAGPATGDWTREAEQLFGLGALTFKGIEPGVYDFNIYATVDGGRVATESEHIVVGPIDGVPEPASLLLLGLGLFGLALRKKTK